MYPAFAHMCTHLMTPEGTNLFTVPACTLSVNFRECSKFVSFYTILGGKKDFFVVVLIWWCRNFKSEACNSSISLRGLTAVAVRCFPYLSVLKYMCSPIVVGDKMFFPCLRAFSPSSPVSDHYTQYITTVKWFTCMVTPSFVQQLLVLLNIFQCWWIHSPPSLLHKSLATSPSI